MFNNALFIIVYHLTDSTILLIKDTFFGQTYDAGISI